MASLTIKNVPDSMLRDLRKVADRDRRSVNQQVIYLLDVALRGRSRATTGNEQQLTAWRELAGKWDSDEDRTSESEAITQQRSRGRDVDL